MILPSPCQVSKYSRVSKVYWQMKGHVLEHSIVARPNVIRAFGQLGKTHLFKKNQAEAEKLLPTCGTL